MRITRFEEIDAWKEARHLVRMVYSATQADRFERDFGLTSQMQRAAVSAMSNIAEGFDSGTRAEFTRFLGYARRSTSEVQCHLYAAVDQHYITQEQFNEMYAQAEKTRKLVSAFARYLRGAGTTVKAVRPTREPANRPTREPANSLTG